MADHILTASVLLEEHCLNFFLLIIVELICELWTVFYLTITMTVLLPLATPSSDVINVCEVDSTPLGA